MVVTNMQTNQCYQKHNPFCQGGNEYKNKDKVDVSGLISHDASWGFCGANCKPEDSTKP